MKFKSSRIFGRILAFKELGSGSTRVSDPQKESVQIRYAVAAFLTFYTLPLPGECKTVTKEPTIVHSYLVPIWTKD